METTEAPRVSGEVLVVTTCWPLVLCALPPVMNGAAIDDMNTKMAALFARRETFALATDARLVTGLPSATERRALAEFLNRPEQIQNLRRYSAGAATILASPLARGALQAIHWLWTPPNPQHVAADLSDAIEFCFRSLVRREVPHAQSPVAVLGTFEAEVVRWRDRVGPARKS